MRLSRLWEQYIDWYHRKFPTPMEDACLRWSFLKRETIRHVFVSVRGVKLLVMVAEDVSGNPFMMCHARRREGHLRIDGFYHGGRLYPARFFNLYLKTGLCSARI